MAPCRGKGRVVKLVVVSHKPSWTSASSPTGFATDGGFPIQMRALSELFDGTTLLVPVYPAVARAGESPLDGRRLSVVPLTPPPGRGALRKMAFPFWLVRNGRTLWREVRRADAVHTPIPGDVGTAGLLLALLLKRKLFVRHCGNWLRPTTLADRFWIWSMERFAGRDRVMLATGGTAEAPSRRNGAIGWIFASSLTREQLERLGRRREGVPAGGPKLLIACRQERDKGTEDAIASLPLVRRSFPHATLDVVGDGSALEEFRRRAASSGAGDAVRFWGKLDHAAVLDRMGRADLFCYPTQSSDGFPKVVLEAMACGLPVVATRVSVLPRLLGSGAGVLVDDVRPESLVEAVQFCLSDPERYRQMSRRAIDTAQSYSLESWQESIADRLRGAWGPLRCASSSN
jgi:glycosyltransferase involved in cell wall biosynthesis